MKLKNFLQTTDVAKQECRGMSLRLLKLRGLSAAMAERSICEGAVLCHNGHLYPV
jgi:hypothetical protein